MDRTLELDRVCHGKDQSDVEPSGAGSGFLKGSAAVYVARYRKSCFPNYFCIDASVYKLEHSVAIDSTKLSNRRCTTIRKVSIATSDKLYFETMSSS